jgi:hypothetical protein
MQLMKAFKRLPQGCYFGRSGEPLILRTQNWRNPSPGESLSDSLKKARPKKHKAIEMEVQGTFVQMMDVRRVKISIGVQLEPPSPVPVEESVEDERESSTAEDEIVVGELLSDTESGSNYSDDA